MLNRPALVAACLSAATCLAAEAREDETLVPADAVARRDVVYADRPSGPVRLDLFTPPGDGPFPLVIWIHGGAWQMGDKASWPHMNFLVGRGFAVANVGYRFSQVAPFPAQLDDVTAALDYLAQHAAAFRLDATRVAVTGESAGGHLASLLGLSRFAATRPASAASVRAVIDLFGPAGLAALADARGGVHPAVEALLGGPLATRPAELVARASPLEQVARGAPPFLVLHGTADALVPIEQSVRLVEKLKAADVPVDFVRLNGAGHAGPAFWTEAMRATMTAFLRNNLR